MSFLRKQLIPSEFLLSVFHLNEKLGAAVGRIESKQRATPRLLSRTVSH